MKNRLKDWVDRQRLKGLKDFQIRDLLFKEGYSKEQINEVFYNNQDKSFIDFFKPNFVKCFLILILFLIIFASFFVNLNYLPGLGEDMCNLLKTSNEIVVIDSEIEEVVSKSVDETSVVIELYKKKIFY